MRRVRLATLLIVVNVALLLLAVSGLSYAALRLLGQLADEQAYAHVRLANVTAQRDLQRSEDLLLTQAQVLAGRPTLSRLAQSGDLSALGAYLDAYRQSSHMAGLAVWQDGRVVASSGPAEPWDRIAGEASREGNALVEAPGAALVLGALAPVPDLPRVSIAAAQPLDTAFTQRLSSDLALPAVILDRAALGGSTSGAQAALYARAVASGAEVDGRASQPDAYVAVAPLRAPNGEVVGVLATFLPASATTASLQRLAGTLMLLALVVVVLIATVNFALGRRLGRPLRRLTLAASQMGAGDLSVPIYPARGQEIGTLALTLEEMRSRLLRLTKDLEQQHAQAQAILGGIVEGVFTVDSERRIRYLNPQLARLLGVAPEEALGRFCGDVLRPRAEGGVRPCEAHCPIIHARFQGGARATEHLTLANGTQRTVVVTSAQPADGQQMQVVRDESEVEAVRRARDSVLANISHEFKTPLTAQLASIELLLDRLPELTTGEIGALVQSLQRGSLRLTQLIDNLLESVRIESGLSSIREQPVALDDVIEESIELTSPLITQRGQQIEVALPYPLTPVTGDAARLTQVFVNLLANASKFAPQGTTVGIGGTTEPGCVALWVEDEGPGLPEAAGQALFERFIRSAAAEPDQPGMGLGLWIAKSIVERHGGTVQAEARAAGGTRMVVRLPATVGGGGTGGAGGAGGAA